jgi:hypothetical protein
VWRTFNEQCTQFQYSVHFKTNQCEQRKPRLIFFHFNMPTRAPEHLCHQSVSTLLHIQCECLVRYFKYSRFVVL